MRCVKLNVQLLLKLPALNSTCILACSYPSLNYNHTTCFNYLFSMASSKVLYELLASICQWYELENKPPNLDLGYDRNPPNENKHRVLTKASDPVIIVSRKSKYNAVNQK